MPSPSRTGSWHITYAYCLTDKWIICSSNPFLPVSKSISDGRDAHMTPGEQLTSFVGIFREQYFVLCKLWRSLGFIWSVLLSSYLTAFRDRLPHWKPCACSHTCPNRLTQSCNLQQHFIHTNTQVWTRALSPCCFSNKLIGAKYLFITNTFCRAEEGKNVLLPCTEAH